MKNLVKGWARKALQVGIAAEILMITLSAGVVIGMLMMAVAMVGLKSAPNAVHLLQAVAEKGAQ